MTEGHWRNPVEFARNPPKLDLLEVGSDQVFNSDVSKIFLCTDVPLSLPRFSYGASFGNLEKSREEKERLREGLFDLLGMGQALSLTLLQKGIL